MRRLSTMETERGRLGALSSLGFAAMLAASSVSPAQAAEAWRAEGFNLDALIEAARAEPPITAYASTGKIVGTAKAFTAKYGVQANGKKVSSGKQVDLIMREGQSGNVAGDALLIADPSAAIAQLLPLGVVQSWLPPDLAEHIPEGLREPLIVISDPAVWAYNTEVYDTCPVTNIWQLTEAKWNRKLAMQDPLGKPSFTDWFNQMEGHWDGAVAAAYESHYGKPLVTEEKSATAAWVKALAANAPLLTDSDQAASDAVGAPGQTDPFMGLISTAKFRDNKSKNYRLGICAGLVPFAGWLHPSYGMIAAGTKSPNAARLFIRYLMTEEGISLLTVDGKISASKQVPPHPKEASGVGKILDQIMPYMSATGMEDFDRRQDWQDHWQVHYRR